MEQQKAIKDIIFGSAYPSPYILIGPPGTGKTTVIVEAISQIYKLQPEARILLTAPSNFACDEITTRLMLYIPSSEIYRMYSKSFEKRIDDIDDNLILVSNLVNGAYEQSSMNLLKKYRIVVCTLVTAGRLALRYAEKNSFNYIFIDECASASEQSALIPISGLVSFKEEGSTNIILAGDPKQLNHIIHCPFNADSVMKISLIERLSQEKIYHENPCTTTRLVDNYRSHKSILEIYNKIFYDGELRAKAKNTGRLLGWKCLPNPTFPVIFHAIYGECGTLMNSKSLLNENEATQVLLYVTEILRNGINGFEIAQTDIGIVSPYAAQVHYIKNIFRKCSLYDIEVGSAEQFQGREKLIMILSTVRSFTSTVGFLDNPRRMNVLLSRAQAILIIVGNPVTLQRDPNWKKLIDYCEENEATTGFDKNYANDVEFLGEIVRPIQKVIISEAELTKRLTELDLAFR